MQKIISDPDFGDITLVRRRGTRKISLSVRSTGNVRLTLPLLCSWRQGLRFLESKREWVVASQERLRIKANKRQSIDGSDENKLREKAKRIFPTMTAELAARYGFRYGRVSIRRSRTRWGSCSARNDISLSIYLAALPEHLQRFVVLHELCHTRIKNHSAAFHTLLDSLVEGQEKELAKELRGYKIV